MKAISFLLPSRIKLHVDFVVQIDVFAEENTKKSTITAHAEDSMDDDSQA